MTSQTEAVPTHKRFARGLAAFFFAFWIVILLAGADFPPPVGFIFIAWLVVLCAFVVYWRTLTYIKWTCEKKRWRYLRILFDGLIAGVIAGAIVVVVPGGGEPSVTPRPVDYVIWFVILAVMGLINALAIYLITVVYLKRKPRNA
jgi:hypothetical protein